MEFIIMSYHAINPFQSLFIIPQSQMTNYHQTTNFCKILTLSFGDCTAIVRWQFNFETPSGAFSWFRKKKKKNTWTATGRFLSHRRVCKLIDRALFGRCPVTDDAFRNWTAPGLFLGKKLSQNRPATGLSPSRLLTEPGRAPPDHKSSCKHRPMTVR